MPSSRSKKRSSRRPFALSGLRLVRNTLPRFISVLLITLLGVGFFYGLRLTGPYMQANAENYLDSSNTMDITVVSTLGFDDDDIAAIAATEGVKDYYAGYSVNLLVNVNTNGISSQVISIDPRGEAGMNVPRLRDGRMPEAPGEILVEQSFVDYTASVDATRGIGDTISFASGTSEPITDTVGSDSFQIVGVADHPLFMADDRGPSDIGSGHNSFFFAISEADFTLPVRNVVYVRSASATALGTRFGPAYERAVDDQVVALEATGKVRSPLRYQSLYEQAENDLNEYRNQVVEGYQKLNDGATDLGSAHSSLNDGLSQLLDGRNTLNQGWADLQQARNTLDSGWTTLNSSRTELDNGWQQLRESKAKLEASWGQLQAAHNALLAAKKTLDDSATAITDGWNTLSAAQAAGLLPPGAFEAQSEQLSESEQDYAQGLDDYKSQLSDYEAGVKEFNSGKTEFQNAYDQLHKNEGSYQTALSQLQTGEANYNNALKTTRNAETSYDGQVSKLLNGEREYTQSLSDYNSQRQSSLAELIDAQQKILDAQADLANLKAPVWYVLGIESNAGYSTFKTESGQIEALAYIMPDIFFLIAALVSMTAITRLVDSERSQIGVFKALGYRSGAITARYLLYALSATLIGVLVGVLIGYLVVPPLIFDSLRNLFSIPSTLRPFSVSIAAVACAIALVFAVIPALFVIRRAVREAPAEAMRPAAPKAGKRIFLERFGGLWQRFSFLQKITARNLFRYKKRLFMTLFGVAGCTALMFTGLGLHDSLITLTDKQIGQVMKYNVTIDYRLANGESQADIEQKVMDTGDVAKQTAVFQETVRISNSEDTKDIILVVAFDPAKISDFVRMRERPTGFGEPRSFSLTDDGVILTEQIARQMGVQEGDQVTMRTLGNASGKFKVVGIMENYVLHDVFMTPAVYQAGFKEDCQPNRLLAIMNPDVQTLPQSLEDAADITAVTYSADSAEMLRQQLDVLNLEVIILILSAAALIFVVLFSLTSINIEERRRELASIEVLGFYDRELASYIYRENIIITVVGALAGLGLGVLLQRYIITSMEIDTFMYSRDLLWTSFVIAVALTFAFSAIVNLLMYRSLTRINMVESLKAVE
ncbi:MAG: FtsX-like permease family protein [Actinomycetia bacterium]|nr:FtsX-like permease family protein [Actinomycetes bacterium]